MKIKLKNNGSVFLMVVFATALLAMLVTGMLQLNTEELQLVQNQIYSAQALATAEAGLNDTLSKLRTDPNYVTSFTEGFEGGSYTVDISGSTIASTGTSPQGFVAKIEADITIRSYSPYVIRIDHLRINE